METLQMTSTKEVLIRFNEVDSMSIVWHGNYVKYLEDGREDFGRKFGLSYIHIQKAGYLAPIVDLKIQYKKSLYYGDSVLVETTFVETEAAKLFFKYRLISPTTSKVLCTATTTQVFLDTKGTLQLTLPDFVQDWKKRWFA
ncbi:acyl-CoA thioester hydrolase [Arcicella aurantiaca]|uniref:Acyl-CoA thioester hydrolase n=1 Tax=Arcicella aurantiaca TaxID=591202 RepID=A0A316E2H6_9BACT|nr:acyl-CoA thioesterase [Arcicella aurantiaca]PWK23848.1 acyl-CoA thioester hydrolase [Arcicella aurantiaca]